MTHHLSHSEWHEFADAFTRSHEGWLISLYVQKPYGRREYIVRDVPFEGITTERSKGREVVVITTDGETRHLTHMVPDPQRMFVRDTNGVDAAVSIIDSSGSETTAEFRSPMPVTVVDGMVSALSRHR
jgi:hypothetical protein